MKLQTCLIAVLVTTLLPAMAGEAAANDGNLISFQEEIDFGRIPDAAPVSARVLFTNASGASASLELRGSCRCTTVSPKTLVVPAGDSAAATVTFDPAGYMGPVTQLVLIEADANLVANRVVIRSVVEPSSTESCSDCADDLARLAGNTAAAEETIVVDLYMDVGCASCQEFVQTRVPEIRTEAPVPFVINVRDVLDPNVMDDLFEALESRGDTLREFPAAIVGDSVFQGIPQIDAGLTAFLASEGFGTGSPVESRPDAVLITAPGVFLAGLVDGINPCAFSTILFLISMLALVGRSRREILVVGIVYTVVVFAGYLAIGFGLFASVRALLVFPTVSAILRWILVAALVVLATLSIRDAWLASRGRTREMTLQLSDGLKRRVHAVVRTRVRAASLIVGTAVLGVLVTAFEFSCTGQVYLPVIIHLARSETRGIGLLILYNVAFIIPLIAVFAVAYSGVAMDRVAAFFRSRLVAVKIGLAVVFLALATATILF